MVEKILDTCATGSFEKVETYAQVKKSQNLIFFDFLIIFFLFLKNLIYDGFSTNQILTQLHDVLIERGDFSDQKKAVLFERIAQIDNNLMEGADEYLQLLDLLVLIMKQMKQK